MTNNIIIFIHLAAAGVAIGSLTYTLLLFLPAMQKIPQPKTAEEHSVSYKAFETLAPTVFVCVIVLIGSGVYYLMENYANQVNLKAGYYNLFGFKMIFVIAAFFLSVYSAFSLRARIEHLDLVPENRALVPSVLKKMQKLGVLSLGAIVLAAFCGVWLARF
jgi:hypothetical protein